jgi:acetyl-CoA synthetase/medium-chain acyl-CoA synthetase
MSALDTQLEAWRRQAAQFRWHLPEHFNFGADVVDAQAQGNRPALLWRNAAGEERRLGFADVAAESNRAAHALRALGIGAGDAVILMLPRVPEWHVMLVALLKIGALAIPSSTILRPKDIAYRANHSGAVAIIAGTEQAAAVDAVRAECSSLRHYLCNAAADAAAPEGWLHLNDSIARQPADAGAQRATRSDEPALVYYTSGTTGPPKAVLHTHGYTWAQRYTSQYWHGVQPGDRLWTTSDTGWAKAAYGVIFGPWSLGAEVVLYDGRFDARTQLSLIADFAPQVFCAPPTEFRMLVKEDLSGLALPRLRECVSAGEPLNPEVIRAWHDATGLTIRDGYGQTESILLVGNYPKVPLRPGSMGLPLPGNRVEVIDADGSALPPGEVGDIAVHGNPPGLFREYWKDAAATAKTRRGAWYVTGDRATRDEDGYFWFVGRDDDVIISAGYRIGPFEVESALIEHPAVVEAAAVAAPDADRGAIVKAFIVLGAGIQGSAELVRELQDHVKRTTAPYKYPRAIEFIDALPKTVSGKIRRVELRARER